MKLSIEIDKRYIVPVENFNTQSIELRVGSANEEHQKTLRKILRYLYDETSGGNYVKEGNQLKIINTYLSDAEKRVFNWLKTRTNGRLRKSYGPNCISSVKQSKYRCSLCKNPDVRVLEIDHIYGRKNKDGIPKTKFEINDFQCLCANCHRIKTVESNQEN